MSEGMFFGSTMLMVTMALVMAVTVTNIYSKKDSLQRCPRWVVRLASRFFPAHLLPPDREHQQLRMTQHRKHSCNGGRQQNDIVSVTDGEIDSLTCGCCCHCQRDSTSGSPDYPHLPDGFDYERAEAEWKMVAKFADRVFFWVFFVLSSAVQAILFTQMVPETRADREV